MVKHILLILIVISLWGCKLDLKDENSPDSSGWLYTSKNKIYKSDGEVWAGRGANLHDTRGCNACTWSQPDVNEVKRRIDKLIDDWGANFIRLTLESYSNSSGRTHWKGLLEDENYLKNIKEIIDYIGQKQNVYVMISLWQDPTFSNLGWPTDKTITIWKKLAETFYEYSYVMYGISNEPQANWNGNQDKQCWESMNAVVHAIRLIEENLGSQNHIIAVQGTRAWARRLDYYLNNPIMSGGGKNIVYETHVYDPISKFDDLFVNPSKTLPIIIGEFGPASGFMTLDDCEELLKRASKLQIPFLAWTFHMRCPPNLLVDNSKGGCGTGMQLEPTAWGYLLKEYLKR